MLELRRGTVVEAGDPGEPMQRLVLEVDGERRDARADVRMVGPAEVGDEVVINVQAQELGLGSGDFDVVHVNLTRGLGGKGTPGAHVMKLNYTSLQHAVRPVDEGEATQADELRAEGEDDEGLLGDLGDQPAQPVAHNAGPVGVFFLHAQLAPICWALHEHSPGVGVGFVQTPGGALPGALSETVRDLRARGLLAGHITAGPTYGGEEEAITVASAIHHGMERAGWAVVLCGPGPGILGSASALGHGGFAALDSAHAALALGYPTVLVPRMSSGDPRPRHQGLSHHTDTVLNLLLAPVVVPVPEDADVQFIAGGIRPDWRRVTVDLDGYRSSGLPARTMGRDLDEDSLFFAAALAGGTVLAEMITGP